jgi:hypothetical protein
MNRNVHLVATAVVAALFLSGCAAGTASVPTPAVTVTQYVPQYVPQQQQYQAPDPVVPEYEAPAPQIDKGACALALADGQNTASRLSSTASRIDGSTFEGRSQKSDLERQAAEIRSDALQTWANCLNGR